MKIDGERLLNRCPFPVLGGVGQRGKAAEEFDGVRIMHGYLPDLVSLAGAGNVL